jgi:hypothetical protein
MKSRFECACAFVASLILVSGLVGHAAEGGSILFIGNSFTYGAGSAVRYYRNQTVTDLNNEGVGGVPALFKVFAEQAGLKFDVAVETRGGIGVVSLRSHSAIVSSNTFSVAGSASKGPSPSSTSTVTDAPSGRSASSSTRPPRPSRRRSAYP